MIKRILSAVVLIFIVVSMLVVLYNATPFGENKMTVSDRYIYNGANDTGSANLVTAVVLNYRGFDTLGEVTVLFLAATGIGAALYSKNHPVKRQKTEASIIVSIASQILYPVMLLFGAYIFVHGHLTPGGGFQGGAIIATAFIFKYIVDTRYSINHRKFTMMESTAGMVFAGVGILGLIIGGYFLYNFLPNGTLGEILSSGILPIIYIAVGIKVGTELTGIIDRMMGVET
jgi:multicomponent Na+:H+ antiporter subunit B